MGAQPQANPTNGRSPEDRSTEMEGQPAPLTAGLESERSGTQQAAEPTLPRVAFFGSPAFSLPVLEAIRERFEDRKSVV